MNQIEKDTIVAFHIGRGGQFYNQGFLSYIGEKSIGDFIEDLFYNEEKDYFHDDSGNDVGLTMADVESGIGRINIDYDYDTTYTKRLSDCSEEELLLILL